MKTFIFHLNSNIRLILASLFLLVTLIMSNSHMEAKNVEYRGRTIVFDQPEGTLVYFDAHLEGFTTAYNKNYSFSNDLIVPAVFTDDGKVYFRYMINSREFNHGGYIWTEGRVTDNGDIVFKSGEPLFFEQYIWLIDEYDRVYELFPVRFIQSEDWYMERADDIEEILFVKNVDGSYQLKMEENVGINVKTAYRDEYQMVTDYTLVPSDIKPICPPKNVEPEKFQIDFVGFTDLCMEQDRAPISSLLVDVIRTDSEIYIRGLSMVSHGDPFLWIKGEINGNKVVFKHSELIGLGKNSQPIYFTPMDAVSKNNAQQRMNGTKVERHYAPTFVDVTFDYNASKGRLSNPSSDFAFRLNPESEINISESPETWAPWDVPQTDYFHNAKIFKLPEEIVYQPKTPKMRKEASLADVDYRDWNGYMMDPEKLFVEVSLDGEPVSQNFMDFSIWERSSAILLPFYSTYYDDISGSDGFTLSSPTQFVFNGVPRNGNVTYKLYYIDGDKVYESTDSPVSVDKIEVNENSGADAPCFDLMGRRISNPDNYKGIMIKAGKKIIR